MTDLEQPSVEIEVQNALHLAVLELGFNAFTVGPQSADGGSDGPFPWIEIHDPIFAPWDTFTELGHDFVVRIETRWRGGSKNPGKAMQSAIYRRLHRTSQLVMAGFRSILLHRELSFVTRLPDGSFSGVCEYHGLLTET